MIQVNQKRKQGFTLIELLLAMSFIAVLLLAIAMLIIRAGAIYSKGMALKDINQSSRLIAGDLQRTLVSENVGNISTSNYATTPTTGAPISGRFCAGTYSYVWNTINAVAGDGYAIAESPTSGNLISLVRVQDPGGTYCARDTSGNLVVQNSLRTGDLAKSVQLITKGDHSLALTNFSVQTSSTLADATTGQRIIAVSYGIGSGNPTAMNAAKTACLPAGDVNSDPVYCNVQQFNSIFRSGGM